METDPGHASQLPGDGARDVAGGDVGGRAPVFTHTQYYPDEGQEGGDLQPRGAAGGIAGKTTLIAPYSTKNNTLNINTPVYASPLKMHTPKLSWAHMRLPAHTKMHIEAGRLKIA